MKFGRRKQSEVEVADAVAADAEVADTTPELDIATDADAGVDEVDAVAPTDKSAPADREGLHLRLEVEEGSQRVVAVGLDYDESTLQVQPFAAPRSTGLWHEIRAQIAEQIERQGGTVDEVEGPFGPELRALVPVVTDGTGTTDGARPARFVGVDGPRWFLRGVIAGKAAEQPDDATEIEELFRSVVVVRGTTPMPPRDLIPLHMPKATQSAV